MMAGLQGAGKTTTTAKIAGKLEGKRQKSSFGGLRFYRPAAVEQLRRMEKQGVPVFFPWVRAINRSILRRQP